MVVMVSGFWLCFSISLSIIAIAIAIAAAVSLVMMVVMVSCFGLCFGISLSIVIAAATALKVMLMMAWIRQDGTDESKSNDEQELHLVRSGFSTELCCGSLHHILYLRQVCNGVHM